MRARHEQQVAGAEPEAAAMDEQVADRHLARDPGIVHPEIGHVVDHLVVPADLACSTSVASAATVNALPVDPVAKMVSASTGAGSPSLRTPKPRASVGPPLLDDRDGHAGNADVARSALDPRVEARRRARPASKRQQRRARAATM